MVGGGALSVGNVCARPIVETEGSDDQVGLKRQASGLKEGEPLKRTGADDTGIDYFDLLGLWVK